MSNLVKTVNATGMQTNSTYDVLGRLLTLTEAGVVAGSYTYDGHGNVSQVQDADNKASHFVYDDFGRRVRATAPDTGQSSSGYDAAGNLLAVTDARGRTVNRSYDALNRPLSQSSAGAEVLFTYDQGANAIGRLTRIVDGEGTVSFAYDEAGRLISETRVIGSSSYTIGYSYSAATGELQTMTYPGGLVVGYSRDGSGRISGMSLDGAPLVSGVSHLPFGPLTSASLGSINLTKSYDQRYNISRIKAAGLDFIYTRDAEGHVSGISGITAPTTGGTSTDYSYDPANNQLTAAPPKSYSYDATGNMLSDGTFTFTWDGLNRLIKVEEAGATLAEYGYDAANRRIRKTVGATTTHYLYDLNNQLIAETLVDGTVLREYIYLDGEPLALQEYQTNPGVYYFINDHLGTPQQLVTSTGTIVWQAAYLPFGQAQITTATVANNLRFPGQYFDVETGLHYNWNRYYDPEVGRYVTADPIGLDGGMNLYAYVENDPVNWVDPEGLRTWSLGISASAGLSVGGGGGTFLNVGHDPSKGLLEGWSASMTVTAGAGAYGGIGAGTQVQATTTDACNVSQLNGSGMAFGSSAGAGIQGGAEYVTNIGGTVKGASYYLGYGTRSTYASPVSTYAFGTTTSPIFSISQGK